MSDPVCVGRRATSEGVSRTSADALRTEPSRLRKERFGRGERRNRLEPLEDRASLLQVRCGIDRPRQADETTAPPEKRERTLGHDAEPLPSVGRIGVGIGSGLKVASCLGEGRVRRHERVLCQGVARLEAGHKPRGEGAFIDPHGSAEAQVS